MTTLAEFLLARIAEDEALAREANGVDEMPASDLGWVKTDDRWLLEIDSARVLAECEAKRRIVGLHTPGGTQCSVCAEPDGTGYGSMVEWPCDTLKVLASVYADHPDYREEWRP